MRRIRTTSVRVASLLIFILLTLSCTDEVSFEAPETVTVGFVAGNGATRTTMLPNGLSASWVAGDEIAVWAKNSSGSFSLSNQVFTTFGIDGGSGYFTSTLGQPMSDGTYTYYCCYPVPESVNGTQATFTIPSVQDGKVTSGADIMIATPVQHGALKPITDEDDNSTMSMRMNRMLHQFRFYIPNGAGTALGGREIKKIELTFPKAVSGSATYDVSNPSTPVSQSLSQTKITLDLKNPINESTALTNDYACVAFAPTAFNTGESLKVRAFTENQIAEVDPIDLCGRNFLAGHSTPVKLLVKNLIDFPYAINFTLSANNVGENVNLIRFTAPSGCNWPTTGTNEYVYDPGRDISVGENLTFRFPDYAGYAAFSGKNITIVLETENAIHSSVVTIAAIPSGVTSHTTQISAAMPYLIYQNFSSINYSDGHDEYTSLSDTHKGITELTDAGLPGWYGTRIGIQSGSARIACRYENVASVGAYYKGRLYTPQFSMLKEGSDVKISVSYKYGSNRKEMKTLINWNYKAPDKSPILYFGINTQDVVTNPDQSEGDILDNITGMISGSGYSNPTPTSLSPMVIKGEYLDKENGSYTSLPKSKTLTIDGVDRYMRLGWILTTDNSTSSVNANYWFYIDEIKVQITK